MTMTSFFVVSVLFFIAAGPQEGHTGATTTYNETAFLALQAQVAGIFMQ